MAITGAVDGGVVRKGAAVVRGAGRWRVVALTFDDGPDAATSAVLDVLEAAEVAVTFFLVGEPSAQRPELVARASALGEIGNHSWNHRWFSQMTREEVRDDLERASRALGDAGAGEVRLFRSPFGVRSREIDAAVQDLGLLDVRWSVDSGDWRTPDPRGILGNVLATLHQGAIVLLHSIKPQTARALPLILGELRRRRYRCVTVSELLGFESR